MMFKIGRLNESSLHKELKEHYANLIPDSVCEFDVGGYTVDIANGDRMFEVQTTNFSGIKDKLADLLVKGPVVLIYPLAKNKRIIRLSTEGEILSKRISPQHLDFHDAFSQLLYIPDLLLHPNLTIELVLIEKDELRVDDGKGSWKRGGVSIKDHRLTAILDICVLNDAKDYLSFLPSGLGKTFTNDDVAKFGRFHVRLARKLTYTLRRMGLIEVFKQEGARKHYLKANGGR